MSDFLSYIAKYDEDKGDFRYYYLTDAEVFSEHGMRILDAIKGETCLGHHYGLMGHDAIRLYFGCDGKPLQGGIEHTKEYFWKLKDLPEEIASKVKEFNKHWGKMLEFFGTHELLMILHPCSDLKEFKEMNIRICEILLKRYSGEDDKFTKSNIAEYVLLWAPTEELKNEAWKMAKEKKEEHWFKGENYKSAMFSSQKKIQREALERFLSQSKYDIEYKNLDLLGKIIYCDVPEPFRIQAWAIMQQVGSNAGVLCNIIEHAPKEWKNKAWEELATKEFYWNNKEHFICFLSNVPEKHKNKTWAHIAETINFLYRGTTRKADSFINDIIFFAPEEWKDKAWERVLNIYEDVNFRDNDILCDIVISASKEWKDKAWKLLLSRNPTNANLRKILENQQGRWGSAARKMLLSTYYKEDEAKNINADVKGKLALDGELTVKIEQDKNQEKKRRR